MLDLKKFPMALQLLMQTDGTVTELIRLLSKEDLKVIKISEKTKTNDVDKVLNRCIFLQGKSSNKKWLYADSEIKLNNLPAKFVDDLLDKNIPIGTLWINHQMETFKTLIYQKEIIAQGVKLSGLKKGTKLLTRCYKVINKKKVIMIIKEYFPVSEFKDLI